MGNLLGRNIVQEPSVVSRTFEFLYIDCGQILRVSMKRVIQVIDISDI